MINVRFLILFSVVFLSVLLRFYRLEDVPAGFHQDEVSQAYNAFSIITSGHDRYGEYFPILFRSFGSYQPPVYTYLSGIPILVFGNTVFAARFLSALAGVGLVVLTYFIVTTLIESKYKYQIGVLSAFAVAISPWAIHFSRRVVEGNVGLFFFMLALYIFLLSLKKQKLFIFAALTLGISTHAYYSERVIAVLFLPLFLFFFRKHFLKYKKIVSVGLVIFAISQIPHIWILTSGAFARRFDQVSYFNNDPGDLPKILYITREFIRHFFIYISPKNLFADTGSELARVSPNLGVFYSWFFLPFVVGIYYLSKKIQGNARRFIWVLLPLFLVPASLTGDVFYPLRTLEYLWIVSLFVGIGILALLNFFKRKRYALLFLGFLTFYSLFSFYISYFILFQYETSEYVGASYIKLVDELNNYKDKHIVIDSGRDFAIGARIAYFNAYDPNKLAKSLRSQLKSDYYSSDVNLDEVYYIDNIEVRPTIWIKDRCAKDTILIGDTLAISEEQVKEHNLIKVFEVETIDMDVVLRGYATNPPSNCK